MTSVNPEVGESIRTGDILTNYHDVGSGDPVLLLHGSGPGVSAFANWRNTIGDLSPSFRLLAPDLAGFGYTEVPDGFTYSRAAWLEHIVAFLDAMGIEKTHVIGNSFGGSMALALAISHPERVGKLILMGACGVPFELTPGLDAVWGYEPSVENMAAIMRVFAYDQTLVGQDLVRLRCAASARPGVQEAYSSMFPAPRQRWVEAMAHDQADLRRIEHPTLLVHGRDDRVIPLATSVRMLELINDSRLHVFGRCGHWTQNRARGALCPARPRLPALGRRRRIPARRVMTAVRDRSLIPDIRDALPAMRLIIEPDVMASYARDHALFLTVESPVAVVFPVSTTEVAELCRLASAHEVPIVPRGAGTGLSGGATAVRDCLIISLERMNRILEIDADNGVAVVQRGVLNAELSRVVSERGLFYPPDPGSRDISTIGGNVATNAGGLCCVKYGVTRDYVIGLEVVLADGRCTRLGRRSRKGVAGLDLTGLFVGSEGVLGIVTEVTVRLLRAQSAAKSTLVAEFSSVEDAGNAVMSITRGCVPSLLEIMDAATLDALRSWKSLEFSCGVAAVLIAQTDTAEATARTQDTAFMERAALDAGAASVYTTDDAAEGAELVAIRRMAGAAIEQLGTTVVDDVAVPVSRLADFLEGVHRIAREHAVHVAVVGHAGDGNMHQSIVFDAADADGSAAAHRAFEEIARLGLALGGTITGEHGVGLLKADLLTTELSDVALDMHRAIKHALDPMALMNPGKVFTPRHH